jgi:TnpA family transposase
MTETSIDRRYYELCALSELKWVKNSRQFKDFEEYLVTPETFVNLKNTYKLPLAVTTDCNQYIHDRLALLETQLITVNRLASANNLPDAIITASGLKITPLDTAVPDTAQILIDQAAMLLPHVKITELLLEVDEWTGFTKHFTHLKSGNQTKDKHLLLTAILADAINLGLIKMAESCPGTTYAKLSWLQSWHIRDETYGTALAELVNAQRRHAFAKHWGDGSTSSSDGQNFRTGSKAKSTGHINPKYGSSPGRTFYTHISDQYAPFHTKVINVGVRDSTYVLDGLLYHESEQRIEEHYTDTAGFTDHVFAMMSLLGFRFAPRIRDLGDIKLYTSKGDTAYEALKSLLGGTINTKHIRSHWDEILRLAASIQQGTVTASLMLRKLGSYPRQNGLAMALRELGRVERTLFILDWLQSVELRRRVHAGLNKGEARNALARAVFFNRLGEIRDRSFVQQCYRASGLNLVTAAIVMWNTVYLERAVNTLRNHGQLVDHTLLQNLSPLGWEHINLTGDYFWHKHNKVGANKFRPLRPLQTS